jgi:hypothetical protein
MNSTGVIHFEHLPRAFIQRIVSGWPLHSQKIANTLIQKYGTPHEATPSMLIWQYNGPWKRTIVHKEGVRHNIPHRHVDILEQTIDTKVRTEAYGEIIKFDGSIVMNRTRGEMTAYCENEFSNIFLLNLAHDIAIGKISSDEAKRIHSRSSDFFFSMLPNEYRDSLLFTSTVQSNDPDMATAEPN